MKSILIVTTLVLALVLTSCAHRSGDIVEQQREELGVEDGGFYDLDDRSDDPDDLSIDPSLSE
jgi:hypothetical protein